MIPTVEGREGDSEEMMNGIGPSRATLLINSTHRVRQLTVTHQHCYCVNSHAGSAYSRCRYGRTLTRRESPPCSTLYHNLCLSPSQPLSQPMNVRVQYQFRIASPNKPFSFEGALKTQDISSMLCMRTPSSHGRLMTLPPLSHSSPNSADCLRIALRSVHQDPRCAP
jgi:hypothetical protein